MIIYLAVLGLVVKEGLAKEVAGQAGIYLH